MKDLFKEISPESITDNPFKLIGKDWMLITAGAMSGFNTMTASWGGVGVLWGRNVCFCFIRPVRHTFQFMEKAGQFTLSFFTEDHRKALNFCGANSGRSVDKPKACGLTPQETADGMVSFKEARMIFECKKLYFHDFDPARFIDPAIEKKLSRQRLSPDVYRRNKAVFDENRIDTDVFRGDRITG